MHQKINFQKLTQNSLKIVEKYQILLNKVSKNESWQNNEPIFDHLETSKTFVDIFTSLYSNPQKLLDLQADYVRESIALLEYSLKKCAGENPSPIYEPARKDKRFQDESWNESVFFDFVKQTYLMNTIWLETLFSDIHVAHKTKLRANFFIRQIINALAPSNFISTNPTVLKEIIATNGENLLKGLNNLIEDLDSSKHIFDIKRIDNKVYEIGRNIATTKGQVVYQNDLMQLIYYEPTTAQVRYVPLLVIPPWINKYYILDLTEHDSFVRWVVNQGVSVFLISWVNPDAKLSNKTFDDYMLQGPIEAINFIKTLTATKDVNVLGYCLGGTLTSITAAYLYSKGDHSIKSATFLTTLLDFQDAGDILVFIDDSQLKKIESKMLKDGYYDGDYMSATFSLLRSNDMIWSFFVNNYLLGKEPLPFDILYWNADSTRLPAKMHSFYLRNMYMENNLAKPSKIKIAGVPVDLHNIHMPCYFLSGIDDHIAPWRATYQAHELISGPIKFVLSGSGHVAGVVNPPGKNKYYYWTNDTKNLSSTKWLSSATKCNGSWWPDWAKWLKTHSGKKIKPISEAVVKKYYVEDAPGSYVMIK